jgi:hypothetical protein
MEVQIVTPYRVSHLQRYGVMERGNVTSVYPPLGCRLCNAVLISKQEIVARDDIYLPQKLIS